MFRKQQQKNIHVWLSHESQIGILGGVTIASICLPLKLFYFRLLPPPFDNRSLFSHPSGPNKLVYVGVQRSRFRRDIRIA